MGSSELCVHPGRERSPASATCLLDIYSSRFTVQRNDSVKITILNEYMILRLKFDFIFQMDFLYQTNNKIQILK